MVDREARIGRLHGASDGVVDGVYKRKHRLSLGGIDEFPR